MNKTSSKRRQAPISIIPIDGQAEDAGLCVDGLCVLPEQVVKQPNDIAAALPNQTTAPKESGK